MISATVRNLKPGRWESPLLEQENDLKVIQKIPEQHTGEARKQGNTENSHTGHCTLTVESIDVT